MTVLVMIDGLPPAAEQPAVSYEWDRLGAVGIGGRMRCAAAPWFTWFGQEALLAHCQGRDLPLGYLAALACLAEPVDPARIWCCVGFTHLYQKQQDLLFLSPERTGQRVEECWALAESLAPEWAASGWQLHRPALCDASAAGWPGYFLLSRAPGSSGESWAVASTPLSELEGTSLRARMPGGPQAALLMRTLTDGQLLLARHPLNLQRRQAGRMLLNTPWLWGFGSGQEVARPPSGSPGLFCTADPVLAGLARTAGWQTAWLDEQADWQNLLAVIGQSLQAGLLVIHCSLPALLARHQAEAAWLESLQKIDQQLLKPLLALCGQTEQRVVISSFHPAKQGGSAESWEVPWVMAQGRALQKKRRFWHRGQFGRGEIQAQSVLQAEWKR
ncbi:MAG: hypothetical protein HQM06_09560 [Magnetococcales bacterium]|nr:hypothetical protein [Magnetococcales bacterium]